MNWKKKLTSRKMWAAIAEFVTMLYVALGGAEDQATQIAALIMAGAGMVAYIVAEGLIDAQNVNGVANAIIVDDVADLNTEE